MTMTADQREPVGDSDSRLMQRIASGDSGAFREIVERHHQRALAFAYRLSGDRDLARDVAHDSLLRISRSADRYRPSAAFTTYLYGIVRNTMREVLRRKGRERAADPHGALMNAAIDERAIDPPRPPDEVLQQKLLGERLADAIRRLPENLRVVFVLSEVEGVSYAEVSRICGCPIGTVASRKHAAVLELRRLLGPAGRS